jgi:hypothetical protein
MPGYEKDIDRLRQCVAAAATRNEAEDALADHAWLMLRLDESARERLNEELADLIAEKPE